MAPLPPGFVLNKPATEGPWTKYGPDAAVDKPAEGPWTKYGGSKGRPVKLPPGFVVVRRGDGTVPPKKGVTLPPGFVVVQRGDQPPNTEELYAKPNIDPALNVPGGEGYPAALQAASNASFKKGGPGPENRTPEDNPMRALDIALQGQRRGLASIPGSFVDITNAVTNMALMGADGLADLAGNPMGIDVPLRMSSRPAFGTDFNTDLIESVIPGEPYDPETEMTPAQRIGYEANNMAAATIVPSSWLKRMAVDGVAQAAKSPLLESLTRNVNPVSDTVAATGAGAAYGAYESMVPEDIKKQFGPIGEILAAVGGASGANLLENFARGGVRGVGAGIDRVLTGGVDTSLPPNPDGRFVKSKDADLAALLVQSRAANPAVAADTIKRKVDDLAPFAGDNAVPTMGILSDDPGLIALEKGQRQSPELFSQFALRDQATERAALANASRIAPENATGRQFTDAIEQQHNARVDAARGELDYATGRQEQLDAIMAQRAANVTAAQGTKPLASQRLDDVVAPALTAAQQAKNDAFDAIDPTGEVQRPVDPLLDTVNEIEANTGALSSPAGQPKALMDQIKGLSIDQRIDEQLPYLNGKAVLDQDPDYQRMLVEYEDLGAQINAGTSLGDKSKPMLPQEQARPLMDKREALRAEIVRKQQLALKTANERGVARAKLREELTAEGVGQISFQDLNKARIDISSQIAAARKDGNYTLADNLARIRNTISGEAERLAAEGGDAGVRAQQAMQEYQRFAEVWNRDPGDPATQFRKDFNLDRQNRTVTPPSQTAERFLQRGSPEKVASLQRVLGDSPDGAQAAGNFLAADLAEAGVVSNGRVNPIAVRKWAASWGPAIDLSPSFRRQIDELLRSSDMDAADATILGRQLREAEKELVAQQQDTAAIRKVLGKDPTNAVAAMFKSGDPERVIKELKAQINGNERATNGLKAAVREYLIDRATTSGIPRTGDGTNPLSFAALDDLFKQNESVLAEIFTPDDMNYLRASHQLLAPLKNLEMRTIPGSQTSANDRVWDSIAKPLEVGLKLRFGVLKGGGLMRTLNLWRQLLPNGDAAAKQLIGRMYFDPELAQHLLTRKVRLVGTAGYNKQLIRLLLAGQFARSQMEQYDQRDQQREEQRLMQFSGDGRGAFAPQ